MDAILLSLASQSSATSVPFLTVQMIQYSIQNYGTRTLIILISSYGMSWTRSKVISETKYQESTPKSNSEY
jgi:hypothetical protein